MVLDGGLTLFNFIITEVCNWNCGYCLFPQIKQNAKHTTKEIIDKHIHYINHIIELIKPDTITVQGGEVGLVPPDILEYFFYTLQSKIIVSTNGEFLKKGFHKNPIIKKKLKSIMLHVADNIDDYSVDINYVSDIQIICGIVDINKNPKKVKKFIQANPNIMFEYIDFENSIFKLAPQTKNLYFELYTAIQKLDNVSYEAKMRILKKHQLNKDKDILVNQNICMKLHPCVYVDLVNERIPLCMRNFLDVHERLTYYKLIRAISHVDPFHSENNVCSNCFRMCQDDGIDMGQILKKSKLKGVLNNGS